MRYNIIILTIMVTLFMGCRKPDYPGDYSKWGIGSYLRLVKTENLFLDASAAASSTLEIQVSPVGSAIQKVNIYAVEGGPDADRSKWKPVKTVTTSDTLITLSVTGSELAAALGIPVDAIAPGSQFTFYNETVTTDGRSFDVTNTEDDIEGQPSFNSAFSWTATVVCPFTNNFNEEYTIILDAWDGNNGGSVEIVPGPGVNEITLKTPFPFADDAKDIIVSVDPLTGAATVAKQVYGGYGSFTDISVQSTGPNNFVFSCTQTIDLLLNHTSAAGNFGNFRMVISK